MSLNNANYGPSSVLNAPALLYAGYGQPLTPYFVAVTTGTTFTIPTSALTWSISTSGGGSAVVNGTTITGAFNLNGGGPLFNAITIAPTSETVYVNYTLNNVIYNTPSYY
jgi:hypothetical protein